MQKTRQLRYPRGAWLWGTALVFVVISAFVLWLVPSALLQHWVPDGDAEERRKLLGIAAQIVLLSLGGIIAVVGVALSLARHGQELQASQRDGARHALEVQKESSRRTEFERQQSFEAKREERRVAETERQRQRQADQERELRSRFVSAVGLLSADAPIKRTAGLYALGALADDWSTIGRRDEAQVCIDVLSGYLRGAAPEDSEDQEAESSVRRTGYALIRTHLRPDETRTPWTGHRFDLSAAPVWFDLDLSAIECAEGTGIILDGCELTHELASLNLQQAQITDGSAISLRRTHLAGRSLAALSGISLHGRSRLDIEELRIDAGAFFVLTGTRILEKSVLDLSGLKVSEDALVAGGRMEVIDSEVQAMRMNIAPGARVDFSATVLREASHLYLSDARLASSAKLDLKDLSVESGTVHLNRSELHGTASINLDNSRFTRERGLDLSEVWVDDGTITASGAVFNRSSLTLPSERVEAGSDVPQTPGIVVEYDGLSLHVEPSA